MKKQIINYLVIIAMAVMANYPIYKNLQDTTKEINAVLDSVQVEIKSWQEELLKIEKDIDVLMDEFYGFNKEVKQTIDNNINIANNTLNKVKMLKVETDVLNDKIEALQLKAINTIEKKTKQIIPGLPSIK